MKKAFSVVVTVVLAAGIGVCDKAGPQTSTGGAPDAPAVSRLHDVPRQPLCRPLTTCAR